MQRNSTALTARKSELVKLKKLAPVTFAELKEWTHACGVRRAQANYEKLARDTVHKGRASVEELHQQGFEDFDDFCKSCPRFSLMCNPLEFAEVGSGYVLYFQFLKFLACLLAATFVFQIVPLVTYAGQDNLCQWPSTNDWRDRYTLASDWANASTCVGGGHWGISHRYLTPGNLGPDAATSLAVPVVNSLCVVLLLVGCFVAVQRQAAVEVSIDHQLVLPDDFAILVSGLPTSATDEQLIANFFREHAVRGRSDIEIVKVVIGWDPQEIHGKLDEAKKIRASIGELGEETAESVALNARLAAIGRELASIASGGPGGSKLRSSGTVVVVFRHAKDLEACLRRWTGFWATWAYYDSRDLTLLPEGNKVVALDPLPRFPIGGTPVMKISVDRAPNPGDIFWKNLAVSRLVRLRRILSTNGRMFFVICVCFGVTVGINKLKDLVAAARHSNDIATNRAKNWTLQLLSFILATGVAATNAVLVIMAKRLVAEEFHNTLTDQEFSQAFKMTVGMVTNTAGVVFLCNAQPKEWYKAGGLVDDLYWLIIITCLVPPFVTLVDLPFYIRLILTRRRLTQEKLDEINARLTLEGDTSAQRVERARAVAEVQRIKRAYEPSQMNNPRRFAVALKTFLCCLLFTPLVPWLSLVGSAGLALQYAVDKYLLLRWHRRPLKPANGNMGKFSVMMVKFVAPLSFAIVSFVFVCPSWKNKGAIWSNFYAGVVIAVIFSFFVSFSACIGPLRQFAVNKRDKQDSDYYFAQYQWPKGFRFHKDHFIYKRLPETVNPEYLQDPTSAATPADAGVEAMTTRPTVYGMRRTLSLAPKLSMAAKVQAPRSDGGGAGDGGVAVEGGGEVDVMSKPLLAGSPPSSEASRTASSVVRWPAGPDGASPASRPSATFSHEHPPAGRPSADCGDGCIGASRRGSTRTASRASARKMQASTARWEFSVRTGWEFFNDDCQEDLERKYQAFVAETGPARATIATHGHNISIYFDQMTSKLQGGARSDRICHIRRRDTE